ncbi:MAG: polysaccharide biosynthesis tyrosine autokinase [Acidobacteriota bacterium]
MGEDQQLIQVKDSQVSVERSGRRYGYSHEAATATEGLDINKYLKVLLKYKYSIISCVIIVMAVTALGLSRTRPTYQASALVQIDPEKADVFDESKLVFQSWLDPEYYRTQLRLLTSPSLARQVVKDLDLEHNPDFLTSGPSTLGAALLEILMPTAKPVQTTQKKNSNTLPILTGTSLDGQFDPQEAERLEPFVGMVLASLQVSAVNNTRLVQITFRHQNPQVAQKIVNAVADAFILNNLKRRIGSSKSTSSFLQKRVAELQAEIRSAEEKLINYGKSHKIVSLDDSQNTVVERLAILNRQVLEAEALRKEAESIHKLSREGQSDAIPQVQGNPAVQALQSRLSGLKQKHAELIIKFTEDWPEVKQTEIAIRQVEAELQSLKGNIIAGIETRYRTELEREKMLRADLDTQLTVTLNQNESAINYKILQQDVETKKEIHKTLLSRLKEVDISAISESNNLSVSDYATLPKAPISPQVPSILALALLGSLAGGIGLAFAREYLDNHIKSVEDVDRFINLPTLGLIPAATAHTSRIIKNAPTANTPLPSGVRRLLDNVELIAFTATNSSIAESYRQLRTSVLLSASDQQRNKVILITSSQPGEGKTTTAINTAISLAQTGARTVLLDCDLRNPRLQKILKLPSENGLSTYLAGHCQLKDLICESPVDNLDMVICGPLPPNPAELLGSQSMKRLLEHLAETHEYVIIDSPPILSFADSIILSSMADGVLLVVHSERSGRDIVQRARRNLDEANARILGVVLNSVNPENSRYGYYYYYNYNYYYRNGDSTEIPRSNFQRVVNTIKTAIHRRHRHQDKEKERISRDLEIEIKPTVHNHSNTTEQSSQHLGTSRQQSLIVSTSAQEIPAASETVPQPLKRERKEHQEKKEAQHCPEQSQIGE